jgi:ElaB/YqjD/DUF883 family membrane-anchored ribosome-binding protein
MATTKTVENINNQLETGLEGLSAQIEAGVESGKYTMADIKAMLQEKSAQAAQSTKEYVDQNPWKVVLIGGALGLFLGILARRCIQD